ncbi:hypothetical protein Vretifemale_16539, partial [Volvox reticuliferus]
PKPTLSNYFCICAQTSLLQERPSGRWQVSWAMYKHDRDDTREVVRIKGEWTRSGLCGSTLTALCKRARRDSGLVWDDDIFPGQVGLSSRNGPGTTRFPSELYSSAAYADQTSDLKLWLSTPQDCALLSSPPSLRVLTPAKRGPRIRNGSSVRPRRPTASLDAALLASCDRPNITEPGPSGLSMTDLEEANKGPRQAIRQLYNPSYPFVPARDSSLLAEVGDETNPRLMARNSISPKDTVMAEGTAGGRVRCREDDLPRFAGGHQAETRGIGAQDGQVFQVPRGRCEPILSPFMLISAMAFDDDMKDDLAPTEGPEQPTVSTCPGGSLQRQRVELTPTKHKGPLPGGTSPHLEVGGNAKRNRDLSHLIWIDDDDINDDGGGDLMLNALRCLFDLVLNDPGPDLI